MIEVARKYDKVSQRTWIQRECPNCSSRNITPMGKRQVGVASVCYYLCEGCGYRSPNLVAYALNGKVAADK